MVVQVPLTLDNWEALVAYGYQIQPQHSNYEGEYSRITVLTGAYKMRLAKYVENHQQCSMQVFHAFRLMHPEGLETSQQERVFVRQLMEAENDISYKSIGECNTGFERNGVLH